MEEYAYEDSSVKRFLCLNYQPPLQNSLPYTPSPTIILHSPSPTASTAIPSRVIDILVPDACPFYHRCHRYALPYPRDECCPGVHLGETRFWSLRANRQ